MFRARALLQNAESCRDLLGGLQTQEAAQLDIPIHSLLPSSSASFEQAIELHGPSGSGKTHLLYRLAIEALLADEAVIVFDTDLKWDNSRLLHLLTTRLPVQSTDHVDNDHFSSSREEEALRYLDHVYIYQPGSLASFMTDVGDLLRLCMEEIPDKAVRYVLVDSFSAFHWQSVAVKKPSLLDVFQRLQKSTKELAALLVYTTWDLGFPYIALPHSTRLCVTKKYVLQFTQGLAQAQETKQHRMEVISRGIFYVSANSGSDRVTFSIASEKCTFARKDP